MRRLMPVLAASLLALAAVWYVFDPEGPLSTPEPLRIVSGSENKTLEPIIQEWAAETGQPVEITYQGSVEIARILEQGAEGEFDAVWPANSLWIALGDTQGVVKHEKSILRSPVVLGIKRPIAQRLGWIGRNDITVAEIAEAAASGAFRLAMTSATQSNSGASAYFGFLHAFAGSPNVLTMEHLADPEVRRKTAGLLAQMDRSSGSSGWLGEAFQANPDRFDAMFNYEAVVIETNQSFTARGLDPLYLVYPVDGLSVADSPLGYVERDLAGKQEAFLALQEHLLSADVQRELRARGRRAGLLGLEGGSDPAVWNPDWGIDPERQIAPIPVPRAEVIQEALRLYQTDLRKPSLTIWLFDVSGSMAEPAENPAIDQLKEAARILFDPKEAGLALLQPSQSDITIVIPFNHEAQEPMRAVGADPAVMQGLIAQVRGLFPDGGTDLYGALIVALRILDDYREQGVLGDYLPAIVVLTDGRSETPNRPAFIAALGRMPFGRDIPIHAIAVGDQVDLEQLEALNRDTVGRLFKAGGGMAEALRKAKGYN